jgi:hypothetical protein
MQKLLAALALATLSACATVSLLPLQWLTYEADGRAHLSFAAPESDWIILTLACDTRSGSIRVSAPFAREWPGARFEGEDWVDADGRRQPWAAEVALRSSRTNLPAAASATVDEMNGGVWLEADVPAADPLWAAFGRSGRLAVVAYGETIGVPDAPRDRAAAFVAACRAP